MVATSASAATTCPAGSTKTLFSSTNTVLSDVDIQAKIKDMSSGTINLIGPFNISKELQLKSCVNLVTPALYAPAVLTWTGGAGRLAAANNANQFKLSRLKIVGRGLALQGDGITVDQLQVSNTTLADAPLEPDLYMIKLIGGTGWVVTNNTFTIDASRTDLNALSTTGIMAWGISASNISNNTFQGVKSGIHVKVLNTTTISGNVGRNLSWAGIELQGDADNTFDNKVTGNAFYNWLSNEGFAYSIAGGRNYQVTNNIGVRKGTSTSACSTATPATAADVFNVPWGLEFTGTNSNASTNTLCGFDVGIAVGVQGQATFTGADQSTIYNNTITNSNVGVLMEGYVESAAVSKSIAVTSNTITNARWAGIADQTWAQSGTSLYLNAVNISSNVIKRAAVLADAGNTYNGISVHVLKAPAGLSISSNKISLSGTPATGFSFRGTVWDVYRDGTGNPVGTNTFVGSTISRNTISFAIAVGGVGMSGGENGGMYLTNNSFSNINQAIQGDLTNATISGNTCTGVTIVSGCY